jgi:hypothetical protein
MGEKLCTPEARRAVAKLIERYFFALKRELTAQTEAFWARVEARIRDHECKENKEIKRQAPTNTAEY